MTDRELLEKLFKAVADNKYIQGDRDSIMDMVQRYKNPPFTMAFPFAMLMTPNKYNALAQTMADVAEHLYPQTEAEAEENAAVVS